jgi:hypothetical protein
MTKRKYKTAKEKDKTVNESMEVYNNTLEKTSGSITFSSITEQEELNYTFWLSLSPEERWAEHYKLLQRVYSTKKNNKDTDNKIIFD